jgi:hypothetical protein
VSCGFSSVTVGTGTPDSRSMSSSTARRPTSEAGMGTDVRGGVALGHLVRYRLGAFLPTTEAGESIPDGPWPAITLVSIGG